MNGIEKKIDNLGRVVIPSSIREAMQMEADDRIELFIRNGELVITPLKQVCAVCGTVSDEKNEMRVCHKCIERIKSEC